MKSRFYLIGYMASGKSYLGRTVANLLEMEFIDLDIAIESLAGVPVPRIFAEQGEAAFRKLETRALLQTVDAANTLVATGGGTPCFSENMDWMNQHGKTIYLDTPVAILAERILESKRARPLVDDISPDELPIFIESHLAGRLPFYSQAQFSMPVEREREKNVQHLAALIRKIQKTGEETAPG